MTTYTIGEVLNHLKDEFDDITISKIRFLESEGLISPDRTDSGYRQFTDADIQRLRYVLRAQRDRYLPLKVIKQELERIDAGLPVEDRPVDPQPDEVAAVRSTSGPDAPPDPAEHPQASVFDEGPTDVRLELGELCESAGLQSNDVDALREHGLLRGEGSFDGDDLQIARAAAALMQFGLEPRHLRMFRQFADREVTVAEQLIAPLVRQRNPDSRRQAQERIDELVRNGARLQRVLLGRQLRELLRT